MLKFYFNLNMRMRSPARRERDCTIILLSLDIAVYYPNLFQRSFNTKTLVWNFTRVMLSWAFTSMYDSSGVEGPQHFISHTTNSCLVNQKILNLASQPN